MDLKFPLSPSDLDRYVEAAGESNHIEAKGPMTWDGQFASAALAKDIAAFANSSDGGVIVIGKSQTSAGAFELKGVTDEQAASFDTTKVAQWVNQRFDPPIALVCHVHKYKDKNFVVITVEEFQDIPHFCIKSFQDPGNPKNHLLLERTIYVRNSNAACAPLATVEELRQLIGLATRKRANEFLAMFDSLLKGRPLLAEERRDADLFDKELKQIEQGLATTYAEQLAAGAWRLVFRPSTYEELRWSEISMLEDIIQRRAVKLYSTFPPSQEGTHKREWGIANDTYGEIWTLARSGQFLCLAQYYENTCDYEPRWIPQPPPISKGRWLEFSVSLRRIFEMTAFAARLCEEFSPGEEIEFLLQATNLQGRKLVTTTLDARWGSSGECKANLFEHKDTQSVEAFRAEWKTIAANAMVRFVEFFPHPDCFKLSEKTAREWVDKFESRDF